MKTENKLILAGFIVLIVGGSFYINEKPLEVLSKNLTVSPEVTYSVPSVEKYNEDVEKLKPTFDKKYEKELKTSTSQKLIDKYFQVSMKALPSLYEKSLYSKFMTDIRVINSISKTLLKPAKSFNKNEEDSRIIAAEFLIESYSTKNNPNKEHVAQIIEKIITSEDLSLYTSDRQKKSVVADKVNLFARMYKEDRSYTARIENSNPSEKVKKWIDYSKKRILRLGEKS